MVGGFADDPVVPATPEVALEAAVAAEAARQEKEALEESRMLVRDYVADLVGVGVWAEGGWFFC